ncbi:MAG: NAD(P)-dependent alcohol dehydrogenase [Bacteroidales bacterium]|nr:NAD(P)-dependent alcohol dehydrogenase [Bacteroidales bacterium]
MGSEKMKAMLTTGYGSPDVLQLQDIEKPQPKADEVLVKVMTASATTADTQMRKGTPLVSRLFLGFSKPKKPIPGTGFSGIVENIGDKVISFKKGDRVFGGTFLNFGTNAEFLTISENEVILSMPENLSFTEAASFCDGFITSLNFLKEIAELKKGQKVLINGASGALGNAAVQIAKYMGAHITAVCSGKNAGLIKSLGADAVIDYHKEDFTKSNTKFDIVFDTVGKSSFNKCKNILTERGIYLTPVLKFSVLLQIVSTTFFGRKKVKFQATGTNTMTKLKALFTELAEMYKEGKLKTLIDRQFPLEKLAQAHNYIESGHKKGNIVIVNTKTYSYE